MVKMWLFTPLRGTMDKRYFRVREYLRKRRYERKRIHKEWVGFGTGLKAVLSDLFIAFQLFVMAMVYAVITGLYPIVWYVCLGLTALTAVLVLIFEPDVQSKISWFVLFVLSMGCGFIIYFLSRPQICFFWHKAAFGRIYKRVEPLEKDFVIGGESGVEKYLNSHGFDTYGGTRVKYYKHARNAMDNMVARIEAAEKFVFMEFFIVADGTFLKRLISIFRTLTARGVKVFMLYDDVGSAGVFSGFVKDELRESGVNLGAFHRLVSPFYFGLNYRDHRKIVVVDGETGYLGGFNLIDDCANLRNMEGIWKDTGLRLDGAAVDALSVQFIRQWEFSQHERLDAAEYLDNYISQDSGTVITPYAGGPERREYVCRGVYAELMAEAKEKLYIMTPYLAPDSKFLKALGKKAEEGVDVRLVLPGVPDYRYIYAVTCANAQKLMKKGVKIYYSGGEFVHAKVMLTEKAAAVGSVNLDMRAFYQEFDNGAVVRGEEILRDIDDDFEWYFDRNAPAVKSEFNFAGAVVTAFLKLLSPLM